MAVVVKDVAGGQQIPVAGGVGGLRANIKDVTFDSSYATGGEPLSAGDLGVVAVLWAAAQPSGGYSFAYDYVNSKLIAYRGDNANGSPGPEVEVSNAVDLSAITSRVVVLGTPAV